MWALVRAEKTDMPILWGCLLGLFKICTAGSTTKCCYLPFASYFGINQEYCD